MHILRTETRSLDETVEPVDLGQSPGEVVALSFTDSDLAALAAAWDADRDRLPSLRLASLSALRHPYSVDLYLESVARHARFVLVRLLGGLDYWRYGVEELAKAARREGFALAVVPGDALADPRLAEASTLSGDDLDRLWRFFQEGGRDNLATCLGWVAGYIAGEARAGEPVAVPRIGTFAPAVRAGGAGGRALILFYRSLVLAEDTAPIVALADALRECGLSVDARFVTSLKDPVVVEALSRSLDATRPDVIVNATAFSARLDDGTSVLDAAGCPVVQAILSGARRQAWNESGRGLSAADLAMNVVLPEIDGRIVGPAISFKAESAPVAGLQFTRIVHEPDEERIGRAADTASGWVRLARTPVAARKIALVVSDYPGKGGRAGYAVGLDTPASVARIAELMREAGYGVGALPPAAQLMEALLDGTGLSVPVTDYRRALETVPPDFRRALVDAWGEPETDPAVEGGAFRFKGCRAGNLLVAIQPDRGRSQTRKADYHDTSLPPCHAYVAFYLWLRKTLGVDAMIHCGTHGTLEWLPGKAVAQSGLCAPDVLAGGMPVLYPFIVNNPGEAVQARRRIAAVTVGHLTPPLTDAGSHGPALEVEAMLDEFAEAQTLDARRAKRLAPAILARAVETGLAEEGGVDPGSDPEEALVALDSWLCDMKELRIRDGLHVFAEAPPPAAAAALAEMAGTDGETLVVLLRRSARSEAANLLAGLDGRFVPPGAAGAPSRGRLDVLPTGRNLYAVDPRAIPTRTAWEIGRRTAEEVIASYVQDHGDWPRRIVLDLWGSATMRTGGDDLAQAFALLGCRPRWDDASPRVTGFEVLPPASLGRPRVDVTLRISGLFRDVFPDQIALFDAAVRAVAALDEDDIDNPLAANVRALAEEAREAGALRIFGAPMGAYGIGLGRRIAGGEWQAREDLGEAYLAATSHAYGARGEGAASDGFRTRVGEADAFVHVQDMADQDLLETDTFAEHEGGFAAAAAVLGAKPVLYHADTSDPRRARVRPLSREIARIVRARASNPRWIAGQMRHGHRGAAEIAETVDNLFAFAALTGEVPSGHFDLLFDATLADERVRAFLEAANPQAARAIAERFREAEGRGLWTSRRNSTAAVLDAMLEVRP